MTITIQQAMQNYLDTVTLARSENTARTYSNALAVFSQVLEDHNLPPVKTPVEA